MGFYKVLLLKRARFESYEIFLFLLFFLTKRFDNFIVFLYEEGSSLCFIHLFWIPFLTEQIKK